MGTYLDERVVEIRRWRWHRLPGLVLFLFWPLSLRGREWETSHLYDIASRSGIVAARFG